MKGSTAVETISPEHNGFQSSSSSPAHGAPEAIGLNNANGYGHGRTVAEIEQSKRGWFAYLKTKNFYIVLVLGYVFIWNITRPEG